MVGPNYKLNNDSSHNSVLVHVFGFAATGYFPSFEFSISFQLLGFFTLSRIDCQVIDVRVYGYTPDLCLYVVVIIMQGFPRYVLAIFNGQNVTTLGDKNMDMSSYGVMLARRMFTDDEIKSSMLFPTRSTARPSLSPTRSQIFREAVTARFGDEDIKEAVVAVNCLGNDLKRGKRKRRNLF